MKLFKRRQSGSILPTVALSMLAIMGMAALVFDASNVFSNKTRLQNIIDLTTLSAATVLDETHNQSSARNAARKIFDQNIGSTGNGSLSDMGLSSGDLTIQFSDTRNPFISSPAATRYVRIKLGQGAASLKTFLMKIFGIETINLSVSAVAGPSPALGEACNIVPSVVCGDPNIPPDSNGMYGYKYGEKVSLALGSPDNNEIGPGNFQLLDLSASGGDKKIRDNLAGGIEGCVSGTDTVDTKPGVNRGPVSQGFNTRFGIYNGPVSADDFPPDKVTDAGHHGYPDSYSEYKLDYNTKTFDEDDGVSERRVLAVTFGNCTGTVNGSGSVPLLGFGCVFLNEPASVGGALKDVQIYGELIRECKAGGIPGPSPIDGPGLHTIQLYGDPDRWDS
ncbi:MAG: pilus assembly protein TadG-related protein [Gammaproteobacteria bacterium]|nr:pilus assembly protein TadG-related protein [Gammaproteobacteria bacterium]